MTQGSPPPLPLHPSASRRQHAYSSVDSSTSACLPSLNARTNTMYVSAHSSPRIHRSSSSEPLAPIPTADFKRWRHQRRPRIPTLSSTLPRRQLRIDCHLSPASFIGDRIDDCHGSSAAEVRPLTAAAASKSCMQQILPSAKCADWALSTTSQLDDSINRAPFLTSKQWSTADLHRKEGTNDDGDAGDNDKEEGKRKLIMWRTACAMAHAYLHQHDLHQQNLHQHGLHQQNLHQHYLHQENLHQHDVRQQNPHELSYHILFRHPIPEYKVKSLQLAGPLVEGETSYPPRVTEHIKNPLPFTSAPSPPAATNSTGSRDEVCMCHLSDVVCIDEVVNPTQAAEWFGTLFSSTSTLVS